MSEFKISVHEKHNIGFTFSFPLDQKEIDRGILITWTKGFKARGVQGKDVVKLLNEALKRKGLHTTRIAALANDTVSTLAAKSYEDKNCDMGIILGTGTNACYPEKTRNIKKLKKKTKSGKMIINIEWGNFNKLRKTSYDRELDKDTINPGEQILEKMVSGMYLGEVTRRVLKSVMPSFNKLKDFKSEYITLIESDNSENLSSVNRLLKKIGIKNSTLSGRKNLKEVCEIVSTRAARIASSAMAAVITKMDKNLSKKHTIAIDGSLYEKHPGFSKKVRLTLKEIFGRKTDNIKISLTKDASGKGAAIIAAMQV